MGRPAIVLKKSYVSSLGVIDSKNINKFEVLADRRMIRNSQVKKILKTLKKGGHFESPIVVNEKGKKWRIIDGNHRIEAMKGFFIKFPEKKIEVNFAVYRDLSEIEERDVFRIWNVGMKQTPDDFLQVHASEVPILEKMETDFPVKISRYTVPNAIKISTLLKAYLGCKKLQQPTSYTVSGERFIACAKEMDSKDYKWLKRFVENMRVKVGLPDKTNPWFRAGLLAPVMRIVYDNPFLEDEFWEKRFDKLASNYQIKSLATVQNKDAQLLIHKVMLEILNSGKHKRLYLLTDNTPAPAKAGALSLGKL